MGTNFRLQLPFKFAARFLTIKGIGDNLAVTRKPQPAMQAPSVDEKTIMQRLNADEGGGFPAQVNHDLAHVKRRRFRKRCHFVVLSLLVIYVVRKWSSVWMTSPSLNVNLDGSWLGGAKPFNWTAVRH